jgi:hypothetical protein
MGHTIGPQSLETVTSWLRQELDHYGAPRQPNDDQQ